MELKDYLEAGIQNTGGVQQLADKLGLIRQHVTNAKAHQRGIPNDACFKLAELLNVDVKCVIAASELATERKEAKRQFWLPFVKNTEMGRTAIYVLIFSIVTMFVTPTPAEASNSANYAPEQFVLCKVGKYR